MEAYKIRHKKWNSVGDHYHPGEVTFEKPDRSLATTSAHELPFVIEDVSVETKGMVVRSGICTTCGQNVWTSPPGRSRSPCPSPRTSSSIAGGQVRRLTEIVEQGLRVVGRPRRSMSAARSTLALRTARSPSC